MRLLHALFFIGIFVTTQAYATVYEDAEDGDIYGRMPKIEANLRTPLKIASSPRPRLSSIWQPLPLGLGPQQLTLM